LKRIQEVHEQCLLRW